LQNVSLLSNCANNKNSFYSEKKKKGRQYDGQKKKNKRTNNNLQNITQKTKDRATQTSLKTGVNSGAPEG